MSRWNPRAALLAASVVVLLLGCGSPRQKAPMIPDAERFVLLDAQGAPAADGSAAHCVYDRRTRLVWELKQPGAGLHANAHTYSWYSGNREVHLSEPGTEGGGSCPLDRCDTEAVVVAVNREGWCGASDWRLPSREEAITLGDRRQIKSGLALDPRAFASIGPAEYWTGSTFRLYPESAWAFNTANALDRADWKHATKPVWLVRGPIIEQATAP